MEQSKTQAAMPAIGAQWPGIAGEYAGLTTQPDGTLYALVALSAKSPKNLTHAQALAWVAGLGIEGAGLPNKAEASLLFANLPALRGKYWAWLTDRYLLTTAEAWYVSFVDGGLSIYSDDTPGAAVAVCRVVTRAQPELLSAHQVAA